MLAISPKTPDAHALTGVPDPGNCISFPGNVAHNFMARNAPGLPRFRYLLRILKIGTTNAAYLNFNQYVLGSWLGQRSDDHFKHARRGNLHSTKSFIHGITCDERCIMRYGQP